MGIPLLTDMFVEELLTCEKEILEMNPKAKSNFSHKETGLKARSVDGKYFFNVFIREHALLLTHFTVGLVYIPEKDHPEILIRYNGPHGQHKNHFTGELIGSLPHIHKFSQEVKSAGFKNENHATATNKFLSLEEAKLAFFRDIKFVNFGKYFPELMQERLL